MTGKDCVAIASDLRLGINQNQTAAVDYSKLHKIHDRLYVGLTGLIADQLTLVQKLRFKHDMYELRENRKMSPKVFGSVVSATLYEKRFSPYYTEPVIAGLDNDGKPYITSMDLIGAEASTDDFVVSGDNVESLFWRVRVVLQKRFGSGKPVQRHLALLELWREPRLLERLGWYGDGDHEGPRDVHSDVEEQNGLVCRVPNEFFRIASEI